MAAILAVCRPICIHLTLTVKTLKGLINRGLHFRLRTTFSHKQLIYSALWSRIIWRF